MLSDLACDHDLVQMGLLAKPFVELRDMPLQISKGHEVPCVDKNVAIRQIQVLMIEVSVADADNPNCARRSDSTNRGARHDGYVHRAGGGPHLLIAGIRQDLFRVWNGPLRGAARDALWHEGTP